ncbi:MAG: GNAT family N-acetyltransferase, partial [Acidimicrobiia bacterium]
WAEAFGPGPRAVATVRRAGRLVAALPIFRDGKRMVSPTNWHTPLFGAIATDDAGLRGLAAFLVGLRPGRLSIGFLDDQGGTLPALYPALQGDGYRVITRTLLDSPHIDLGEGWEAYRSGLQAKKLRELRRRRRRLDELGRVDFEVDDGSKSVERLLDEGFEVEASGWKGRQGTAISADGGTRAFYSAIARWAAAEGMLRLAFLRIDGRPIAFDLCLEDGLSHYLLKTGYRPEFGAYGPGAQLRAFMVERAFDLGLSRYEFGGADDAWKLEWTRAVRRRVALEAFARTPSGTLGYLVARFARPAMRKAIGGLRRVVGRSS